MIPIKQSRAIFSNISFKDSLDLIIYILDVSPCALNVVKINGIVLENLNVTSEIELSTASTFEWKQSI